MSAAASPSDSRHQRARGELRIDMRLRGDTTALADLYQQGCLKARFPNPAGWTEAILLNSSGGIAGGDRMQTHIRVHPGAAASFAGQAAERVYRALPDDAPAHVRTHISVEAGGAAEWLPQETILFESCGLDRVLDIDIAEDGWFLGVECLVFGRTAMGEQVHTARLRDTIRIRREGRLILHDAIRLEGAVAETLTHKAVADAGCCMATLVHAAPDATTRLDALRSAWTDAEAGASAWNGMLVGRIVAQDGACLRRMVVAGLQALRAGRALPRVWTC
jgi:urease accessory protein